MIKYLKVDADGNGVWVDTGSGDYYSHKAYIVPVGGKQAVIIAYCSDMSDGMLGIKGYVSFYPNPAEGQHPYPTGYVNFWIDDYCGISETDGPCFHEVRFYNDGDTPYVNYNRMPDTAFKKGSLTILPQ